MHRLYHFSIRHPWTVNALGWGLVLAVAPGVLFLRIRTDGHALVPEHAPEIAVDRQLRESFGLEDPVVVLIQSGHARGVFNFQTLELVDRLTNQLRELPGIRLWNVVSLATEKTDRVRPGTLIFRTFLEPPPETEADVERIRDDLRAIGLYTGTLVSRDESATAIFVGAPSGMDRTKLYQRVHDVIAGAGEIVDAVHVIGAPVAEALLGSHILEDLGVPEWVLGHRTYREPIAWHWPGSWDELRILLDRKIGLVPIALMLMAVVFLISFRGLNTAMLPLMEVGACLLFVFGVMGYLGVPVYLTIAVTPVILTVVGVADEIHIFCRYRDRWRANPLEDHREVIRASMADMCWPVVMTSVTTSIGFLSFGLSPIAPVRAFGVFTALGVLFCMFWSLTVIPASLTLCRPPRVVRREGRANQDALIGARATGWLSEFVARRRLLIVMLAVAVVAVTPLGIRRIQVQDSWIDGFSEQSEFYQATQFFNAQFLGTHMVFVHVHAGDPPPLSGTFLPSAVNHHGIALSSQAVGGPASLVGWHLYLSGPASPNIDSHLPPEKRRQRTWDALIEEVLVENGVVRLQTNRSRGSPLLSLRLHASERGTFLIRKESLKQPDMLERVRKLEAFLSSQEDKAVGGVLGPVAFLSTTNFMARGRAEGSRTVPPDPERIDWLWKQYGAVRGTERLRQLIDDHYAECIVQVYLKHANFQDTARLLQEIRSYEAEHLRPHGMSLSFAGDTPVSQTLIGAIVSTQVRSLAFALLGIFLVTAMMGRSIAWGGLSVLPCAAALLGNFAIMGWMGVPLGVATSMFSGMTLGIGVDFAIHLLGRYRQHRAQGAATEAAVRLALQEAGPAIAIDALAITLGFGVMILSQVPANARLGALVVLSIVNCMAITLFVLPAILHIACRFGAGSAVDDTADAVLPRGESQA